MGHYDLKAYWDLTKPKIVSLLAFTSLATYLFAAGFLGLNPLTVILPLSFVAIWAGSSGADAVTGYIDRDIDSVMSRTKGRPLPTKKIHPPVKALWFGLALLAVSLLLSYFINWVAVLVMAGGILGNVVIYSAWLKRRNPVNVIIGGISGGMPALYGWTAASNGDIPLLAVLIGATVVAWIPNHIWNLALHYKDDYKSAGVPMLPVVVSSKTAVRCISSTVPVLFVFTILIGLVADLGAIYWLVTVPSGAAIVLGNLYTAFKPSSRNVWRMFRVSSPYLALLFTAMVLDIYFPIG